MLNDPPYGSERSYNALRLAHALSNTDPKPDVTVFLMADAVVAARKEQKTPDGYYNMERMLRRVLVGKGEVLLCGTCMEARGMADDDLMDGARRSYGGGRQGAGLLIASGAMMNGTEGMGWSMGWLGLSVAILLVLGNVVLVKCLSSGRT